ncbi:MAG: aconitase family protein [Pyrinomonadaceae bacterium]
MTHNLFNTRQTFQLTGDETGAYYSLPQLEREGIGPISTLPVSIRIVLESVLRNFDGKTIEEEDVRTLANWEPNVERSGEIPFVVARVLLQDFTGVPLLVDLAAMRSAVARIGKDPQMIEPLVPVDLVIDHSVQVDFASTADAFQLNMEMEFKRNQSRYQFLKWGTQAFQSFTVVPPGIGICHQVNLSFSPKECWKRRSLLPGHARRHRFAHDDDQRARDRRLGRRRHRSRGRHARPASLFLTPDVVGVHLSGSLREGVTATDLCCASRRCCAKRKWSASLWSFTAKAPLRCR